MAPLQEPWHGLSVYGAVTRHVADTALFLDATGDGEPLARRGRRARARASCGSPSRRRRRRRSWPRPTASSTARSTTCASCCAGSATTSAAPRSRYGTTGVAFTARYFARRRQRGGQAAPSRAPLAPHQGLPPPRQRDPARRARARPRGGGRQRRARSPPSSSDADVADDADVHHAARSRSAPTRAAARCGRSTATRAGCRTARRSTTPASRPRRCPPASRADGFPLAVQLVGRPGDEATLALARRPDRGRAAVGGPRWRRDAG